jgi:small subunit ribosomal protein S8e
VCVGITRDSIHKRRKTGGKINHWRKKKKYDLGRQAANTKLGGKRVHLVRVRGGNYKFRALRLETGNFSWGTESKSTAHSHHFRFVCLGGPCWCCWLLLLLLLL